MNFSVFHNTKRAIAIFFFLFLHSTFTAATNSILLLFLGFTNLVFTVYRSNVVVAFFIEKLYAQLFALALFLRVSDLLFDVQNASRLLCVHTVLRPAMFIHHPTLPFCLSLARDISGKEETRMRIQIKFESLNVHLLCNSRRKNRVKMSQGYNQNIWKIFEK